ncbi:MAG: flagellar motor switch protein FliG [Methylobacteriaceae bacterium]|nr:flagellar motor switch protein FliG [Methylobacteriaceae bacterium]
MAETELLLAPAAPAPRTPSLDGRRKAAAIMLLLGEQASAPIWEHLDEEEVRALSYQMTQLGSVPRDAVRDVAEEFVTTFGAGERLVGNFERTEAFLRDVLPSEKAEAVIEALRGQTGRNVWQRLSNVDANLLSAFLKGEHPQTVALILSRLPSPTTATILSGFPDLFAVDVLNRMLKMNSVRSETVENVEQVLHTQFLSGLAQAARRRDSHEIIAEVFNAFDRDTERKFMEALERVNEPSAVRVKALMFTFDDLLKFDAAAMQTLLRGVDRDLLPRALKGTSERIQQLFLKNMSSRAAKILQDDLAALGPLRAKEVHQAQAQIITVAKGLVDRGEIRLTAAEGDEQFI